MRPASYNLYAQNVYAYVLSSLFDSISWQNWPSPYKSKLLIKQNVKNISLKDDLLNKRILFLLTSTSFFFPWMFWDKTYLGIDMTKCSLSQTDLRQLTFNVIFQRRVVSKKWVMQILNRSKRVIAVRISMKHEYAWLFSERHLRLS